MLNIYSKFKTKEYSRANKRVLTKETLGDEMFPLKTFHKNYITKEKI